MLNLKKPKFDSIIAELALKERFAKGLPGGFSFGDYRTIFRDFLTTENGRKMYLKMLKIEMNKITVDAVLESLPEEKRKFVLMKYEQNRQLVAISMNLNVSVSQLMVWNGEILEMISDCLFYKLNERDIFGKAKIAAMIKILSRITEIFSQIDPKFELIRKDWFDELLIRKTKYEKLLTELEKVTGKNDVVAVKIKYPEKTLTESEMCFCDISFVSRNLKKFVQSMKKYIE